MEGEVVNGNVFCDMGQGPLWTPSNLTAKMWFPSCTSTYLIEEMAEFNRKHPWELVSFPSRHGEAGQEDVTISAWWLPVSDREAPRIALIHGSGANFNDWSVQLPAYLLRSMGFAVLLPSLRDHGASGASNRGDQVTWGWAYHLDVLGSWDYLVGDPAGKLGGPLPPAKVGLHGVSMGAFAAAIAAGVEPTIPGMWLDTPVYEPRNLMLFELRRVVGALLAPWFVSAAWLVANHVAGVQLDHATPAKVIPSSRQGPGAIVCTVGAVADLQDSAVPESETELLVHLLRSDAATSFRVLAYDKASVSRCGSANHLALAVWAPDAYRQKLCHFWTETFDKPQSYCMIEGLPRFAMDIGATSGWRERRRPQFG